MGNTDAGSGDVTLNLAEVTGAAAVGTVHGNNVTVQAAQLGTTSLGAIIADGNVSIDAMGVLGGSASASAVNVTSVTATTGDNQTISVQFDGNSDMTFGALTADTVNLDASNYLGSIVTANVGGTVDAAIGAITADAAVIKGSEIGANSFTINADTLTYTGGLADDEVTTTADVTFKASGDMGAGTNSITVNASTSTTSIDISGLSNCTSSILDGTTANAAVKITGGAGADTIKASGHGDTITGGAGADIMTAGAGADIFVQGKTDSGITEATADSITSFVSGTDKIKTGTDGTVANFDTDTVAASSTFDVYKAAADNLLDGTKIYAFVDDGTNGYLFWDTDGDGSADQAISLVGLKSGDFVATDIVA